MLDFDLFDPAEMTGFVRELRFDEFSLDRWFPNQFRQSIDYSYSRADKRREEMGSFRGFDVPAPIGDRPGVDKVRGNIPPLSKKLVLTEWERLNLEMQNGSTVAASLLRELAYDDAMLITESLLARLEYARGTVLQTGTVTYVTDTGFTGIVTDYGTVTTATASPLWTDHDNATPFTDLRTWTAAYVTRNKGRRPGVFLTSEARQSDMLLCAEFRAYAAVGATIPSILTPTQVNTILAAHGIPPVETYDAQVNVPGSGDTRVIAENVGLLLPPTSDAARFGETTHGVTAEALELVGKGFLSMPTAPGFVGVGNTEFDPVTKWTKVAGLALPVCKDVDLITVATLAA